MCQEEFIIKYKKPSFFQTVWNVLKIILKEKHSFFRTIMCFIYLVLFGSRTLDLYELLHDFIIKTACPKKVA